MVIAKLVNRRDALAFLRNKKKLHELSPDGKRKLKTIKVYINVSPSAHVTSVYSVNVMHC